MKPIIRIQTNGEYCYFRIRLPWWKPWYKRIPFITHYHGIWQMPPSIHADEDTI